MALYIDENEYPQNYDWIPQDKQDAIVDFLNDSEKNRMSVFNMARSKNPAAKKHAAFLEQQWRERCAAHHAIENLLESLGIKAEYDWVGHRGKYFLATYDDALAEQDYLDDIARDAEGDVDEYIYGGDYDSDINY